MLGRLPRPAEGEHLLPMGLQLGPHCAQQESTPTRIEAADSAHTLDEQRLPLLRVGVRAWGRVHVLDPQ